MLGCVTARIWHCENVSGTHGASNLLALSNVYVIISIQDIPSWYYKLNPNLKQIMRNKKRKIIRNSSMLVDRVTKAGCTTNPDTPGMFS